MRSRRVALYALHRKKKLQFSILYGSIYVALRWRHGVLVPNRPIPMWINGILSGEDFSVR
jgi:hypothetical protein